MRDRLVEPDPPRHREPEHESKDDQRRQDAERRAAARVRFPAPRQPSARPEQLSLMGAPEALKECCGLPLLRLDRSHQDPQPLSTLSGY